tara:strand:- start:169 stop:774 length:606 start_codon:yes stop_codon:yes gene_type:complete
MENQRKDLSLISDLVEKNSKILDVGCGNGELLNLLEKNRNIRGQGLEINQKKVNKCVTKGLSVIQGDADEDLSLYPDKSFDCVILSQTIQATQDPKKILSELIRIGKKVIISIPNFGHWRVRFLLLFKGKMPITKKLDSNWFDTQNIHLCTITDFIDLCIELEIHIIQTVTLHSKSQKTFNGKPRFFANLVAEEAIFLIEG